MFLAGVISHLCRSRGIIKYVSTNRLSPHAQTARRPGVSRLWVIERSQMESRGVFHWSRAALHRSSSSGSQQVWLSKPREIFYLEPPHCAWLYSSAHFCGVEEVWGLGGVFALVHRQGMSGPLGDTSPVWSQARRERWSRCLTSSHVVALLLWTRFIGLESSKKQTLWGSKETCGIAGTPSLAVAMSTVLFFCPRNENDSW